MTLSERTREIGLLRAAGTTGGRSVASSCARDWPLGWPAPPGPAARAGVGAILVAVVASSRTALVTDVSLNPAVIVLALALGLGVTLLAAWGPAAEAARSARWRPSGRSRPPGAAHGAGCAGS